jgi:UDP-GlcNAc:undecaprenyl-phosphate GlcNAc-1-phosphate transferase
VRPSFRLVPVVAGALLVPAGVGALHRAGHTRANWRDREVAFPGGLAVAVAAALALPRAHAPRACGYVLGVSALGLLDDLRGERGPRGLAGHLGALRSGRPSTGVMKAAGALALAPLAVPSADGRTDRGLGALVLLLATHAGNLLDLRPGRAIKALLLLGGALTLGTRRPPPEPLPAFLGPVLAFLPYDLRERAMLGDTGSGLVGALAGLWLVAALGRAGRALAASLLAALTLYGEVRSISASIERIPGLRHLDSIGRADA